MVCDGVANMVSRLRECGFEPRKVDHDAWESRCPGHHSLDHALSIARNEFNHVVLECRGAENCPHTSIVRALGITNDHLYAETPEWMISQLRRVAVQPSMFAVRYDEQNLSGASVVSADEVHGLAGISSPFEETSNADATERCAEWLATDHTIAASGRRARSRPACTCRRRRYR